jgi:ubiquinone biosynthesis protein COQ9
MGKTYHSKWSMSRPLEQKELRMSAPDINELTLDELRPLLGQELPGDAAFDGWGKAALASTAARLGLNGDIAGLVFPGGQIEMIEAWFASVDSAMLERLSPESLSTLKIRERITALVEARLTILAPHREALRRAQAILASPRNAGKAAKLGWHAADVMWRAAGDTATDYNHYSKRAILGSVYAATLLIFVNDDSEDWADTRAFLARRIEGIMRFEKAKAQWTKGPAIGFSPARFLGRLRYPAR